MCGVRHLEHGEADDLRHGGRLLKGEYADELIGNLRLYRSKNDILESFIDGLWRLMYPGVVSPRIVGEESHDGTELPIPHRTYP